MVVSLEVIRSGSDCRREMLQASCWILFKQPLQTTFEVVLSFLRDLQLADRDGAGAARRRRSEAERLRAAPYRTHTRQQQKQNQESELPRYATECYSKVFIPHDDP